MILVTSRRLYSNLLALGACLSLVGGCAGEDGKESSSESATTSTSGSTTDAETGSGSGSGSSTGTGSTGTSETDTAGIVMCDPVAQDCPGGEKCSAYEIDPGAFWQENKCVPVMGDKQVGESCDVLTLNEPASGIDDCAPGLICLEVNPDGSNGVCYEFCGPDETCSVNNGICIVANDGALPICLVVCDPLIQDCPSTDQACVGSVDDGAFICFKSDVSPENPGMDNDECAFDNACVPGFQCLPPDVVENCEPGFKGCCNPFCALDGDMSECGAGEQCSAFFPEPTPPWENVGICTLP